MVQYVRQIFLSNFVKEGMDDLDIAGVDFKNNFSTGFGIRLLSDYIEKIDINKNILYN